MKKIALLLAAVILGTSLFTSCAAKLSYQQDGMYDRKSRTYYSYAPLNIEALSYAKDVYIKDGHGYGYHAVFDAKGNKCDPTALLYDPDSKTIIYNSETEFPAFSDFKPDKAIFYVEGNVTVNVNAEEDAAAVSQLSEILNNPAIAYPSTGNIDDSYRLKFYSEKYPFYCFCYIYIEYSKDKLVDVKVQTLDGYTFIEGVPHSETKNADGSYTVTYNYGNCFLYSRENGMCYMAQYIHDKYNVIEETAE